MKFNKDINRAPGNPGLDYQPKEFTALIDIEDIEVFPQPDENGVVITDNIILREGAYAFGIYMTPGTAEATATVEGDTDKAGFKPALKFSHPGSGQEVREFKVGCINKRYIALQQQCDSGRVDLIGTPCNPCKITPSYTGNSDGSGTEFTIEQISKGNDAFIYRGTIPFEAPVAVIEDNEVIYIKDGIYASTGDNTEVTSISGGKDGSVITLTATTGRLTVKNDAKLLLRGGADYTVTGRAQITLKAFDNGKDKLIWIEQSRYEG